ncbi:MAG: hypothetical protein ABEK00_01780 [Candidatus Nanohaloarchaea archaeon]
MNDPALPEGKTYQDFRDPLRDAPVDFGDHLLRLAESVNETVEKLYHETVTRKEMEERDIEDGELDKEIVYMAYEHVPEALEDLGEEIEEAREIEKALRGLNVETQTASWEEDDFLEKYREAEGLYREAFQHLGRPVDGRNVIEYIDDRYRLDLGEAFKEVPEPRPDFR